MFMKRILKYFLPLLFVISLFFNLNFAFAANQFDQLAGDDGLLHEGYGALQIANGVLSQRSLPEVIGNIIKVILGLSGTVALVFIVWGGIDWMSSMGNKDKIKAARERMINAFVGIAIIATAYAITDFVIKQITVVAG